MKLPGGTVLNGSQIYEEAEDEIKKLKKDFASLYEEPPMLQIA